MILGFANSKLVVWLYDTEAAEYLGAWTGAKIIYDCVDDHASQAGPNRNSARVRAEEKDILRRAHVVAVTSQHLYEQKKLLNANTHLVEQAADVELFMKHIKSSPATAFAGASTPTIGSVGALDSYKYDFDLIETVARGNPAWQFVFVGEPVVDRGSRALTRLAALPNVRLVGAVPREEVPHWVARFNVCIIPYRASDYNRSSFPLKFWEFMASGKPLVVSGLPELTKYKDLIGYATNAEQFAEEIQKALALERERPHFARSARDERVALALKHSWEQRVEHLMRLLS